MSETAGWAREVYELYAEGGSDAEVAAHLKLTLKEFYKQMADNDKFATLVEMGRTVSEAWWVSQFRKNLKTKGFNSTLLAFYMKNKYGWADKIESNTTNENLNTNLESLREQVNAGLAKYIAQYSPELTDAKKLIESVAHPDESN